LSMNIAVSYPPTTVPSARILMERALEPYILLGMPHLTPLGVSENWLLKELGHRHWLMLALRLGLDNADFRTADGRAAYASICATSRQEHGAGLRTARPNDILELRSSITSLPRNRHSSSHTLKIAGQIACEVELVSTFVARETELDNHSLARIEPAAPLARHAGTSELVDRSSRMRKIASARENSRSENESCSYQARFSPSQSLDFNGAGLLYFANFQAFLERTIVRSRLDIGNFKRLESFFFGNIRAGEDITVRLRIPADNGPVSADIARDDGKIIATFAYGNRQP
jgi:probable biosynthetic protein (TIGR04099 family)